MNQLARYISIGAAVFVIGFFAWYFSSILSYILISVVIALISKPIMKGLCILKIGKIRMPRAIAALITLIIIMSILLGILGFITPLIAKIISQLGNIDFHTFSQKVANPLSEWNTFMHNSLPELDPNLTLESLVFDHFKDVLNLSIFSNIFNSITGVLVNFGIAIFSISFISYFFIKDNSSFTSMLTAIVPDRLEQRIIRAMDSIDNLLVRYFVGISIETILITILNTIGLHFIAGMDFSMALVLAFLSGVINVIPYIGPLTGAAIGILIGLISYHPETISMSIELYILTLMAIYSITHLIDVFIFQPYIYSNSVKAHPLEIFIVILLAGHIGGVVGMLIAIPSYTAIRVFAREFLTGVKIVQRLTDRF